MDISFSGKVGLLWAVVIAITLASATFGLRATLDSTAKIVVAIIGASAILMGAILSHVFTAAREQQLERQRRVQENYKALVSKLTPFVRSPKAQLDEITSIYFDCCVIGSAEVIRLTASFLKTRSRRDLGEMLTAMRLDIGLPEAKLDLSTALPAPESGDL